MRIILCAGQNGRAVIVGDVSKKPVPGKPVALKNARMVLYWSAKCGGLFGLAANGPQEGTRITHAVKQTVETVWQEWAEISVKAAEAIDAWPNY